MQERSFLGICQIVPKVCSGLLAKIYFAGAQLHGWAFCSHAMSFCDNTYYTLVPKGEFDLSGSLSKYGETLAVRCFWQFQTLLCRIAYLLKTKREITRLDVYDFAGYDAAVEQTGWSDREVFPKRKK